VAHPAAVFHLALQHLAMSAAAVAIATALGVPIGLLISRVRRLHTPVLTVVGLLYLIPSLVLFAFLIPFLGLGFGTAVTALVLYSLMVIVRNVAVAIDSVDPGIQEAARGIGMSDWQRLRYVELPLALSVMLGGVRIAMVMSIGVASVAAYVGAGGLGSLIFRGIATADSDLIVAGAMPIAALALAADFILRRLETAWRRR
jgi:osmoprotectant transport system permease protein